MLGLSASESLLIESRLALSDALRARRAKLGWTQTRLAKAIGSSQSRVAKMEAGDKTVSIDLLVSTLGCLGATCRELSRILAQHTG